MPLHFILKLLNIELGLYTQGGRPEDYREKD